MESPSGNTTNTPEVSPEITHPAAVIALSGVEKAVLDLRIGLTERKIGKLEKQSNSLGGKNALTKASARSVLKIGRQDTDVAIGDPTDNPEGWVLNNIMPTPKEPSRQDYREGDEGESDYQEALEDYQERLGKHNEHTAEVSSITRKVDGKAATNIGLIRDAITERAPKPSEEETNVVNSNGKVTVKSYKAMQPVTYRERRTNRRHHKKRRQNFDKAVSAFTIKEAFGEHRIDPNNAEYDRKLKDERLTRGERKAIRKGRRFQGRNIRTYNRNKASLQKDAQGNDKDIRKLVEKRVKKEEKLVKLHDIKVRSSNTYKEILTQQALDRFNRELVTMPSEKIKETLRKRFNAKRLSEPVFTGEDELAQRQRIEAIVIGELMASISDAEKEQLIEALQVQTTPEPENTSPASEEDLQSVSEKRPDEPETPSLKRTNRAARLAKAGVKGAARVVRRKLQSTQRAKDTK
jgi:hypothetical protein